MSTREFQDGFRGAGEFEPVAAPLYGIRQWRLRGVPPRLVSTFLHSPWSAGENVAACSPSLLGAILRAAAGITIEPHQNAIPDPPCNCGFWAYSPPAGEPAQLQDFGVRTVVGVVEAWGRTVVGPLGFRAEKARIVALAFPTAGATDPAVATSQSYTLMHAVSAALEATCVVHDHDHSDLAPVGHWEGLGPDVQAALAAAYPGAAQFPTIEAMLAEVPLTDLAALVAAS